MKKLLPLFGGVAAVVAAVHPVDSHAETVKAAAAPTTAATVAAGGSAGAAAKTVASNSPEAFVDSLSQRAISSLTDPKLSETEREARFRVLFLQSFDDLTIARFVLGPYWRSATEAQRGAFRDLFREILVRTYARRFSGYNGEKLVVQESQVLPQENKIVVKTVLNRASEPAVAVDWRLKKSEDGQYHVIDLVVEGVSMSVTQRNEYLSLIQRGGGSMDNLITLLQQRLSQPASE
jgi:phospholipid transport system substrate-binding protein